MPEIYHFLECSIKRVGSAPGDSAETAIDAFCEGISISVSRDLQPRTDTDGVVKQRIETSREASMEIKKMYHERPFLCDGNNIKLYMQNDLGTQTWLFAGAYWGEESFAGTPDGDGVSYDLSIVGRSFGTT